jgi:two-component system, chemotaxis family, response regulator Rcp1
VIEDNVADVRLLEEIFQELQANVKIHVAKDGAEGLESLERFCQTGAGPDLILLDLNLPKVSGHEVLLRLKQNPQTSRIPVLVLTSSRADSDITLAYEFHANAYLKKPATLDEFFGVVRHIKNFWLEVATLPH